MSAIPNADAYLALLRRDGHELDELSRDLLINVTAFFRDPGVFDYLAQSVIPEIVHNHPAERPLRIWVAGCSSGQETYSLAILFREQILAAKREIKLQIFASDVDSDAVATAREGLYPQTIEANVSPERLANIFSREDQPTGFRRSCAPTSSSRFRTCSPIRPSRASISFRAAIC